MSDEKKNPVDFERPELPPVEPIAGPPIYFLPNAGEYPLDLQAYPGERPEYDGTSILPAAVPLPPANPYEPPPEQQRPEDQKICYISIDL
jgi:hypothetical protein